MPDNPPITPQEQGALVRYSTIKYLTECLEEGLTLADALKRAATKPWPSDHGRCYAARTLEDWWYTYQKMASPRSPKTLVRTSVSATPLPSSSKNGSSLNAKRSQASPSKSPTNVGSSKTKAAISHPSPLSITFLKESNSPPEKIPSMKA